MSKLCGGWKFTSNHLSDEDGRIIFIWRDPGKVRILNQSRQSLTCQITLPNSKCFTYTSIYASNLSSDRTELWVELLNVSQTLSLNSSPWMLGGDFNQILYPSENSNPDVISSNSRMLEFRDCLTQLGMFDLRFQGPLHTWTSCQPESPVAKKLDRLLVNCHLLSLFPNSFANFLPPPPL
ncbi:unnamed protein product [Microthlaspi erraticum]|uniref:Endonuclease/exonuclease/phosphatase domain-containing protein n=1 Tax=Microthlaspi erraticum TaxID=1685480 RepID=A0A6D2HGH1_9BRAS|nr:unnamed protein product [Microthlaspi erraticum]